MSDKVVCPGYGDCLNRVRNRRSVGVILVIGATLATLLLLFVGRSQDSTRDVSHGVSHARGKVVDSSRRETAEVRKETEMAEELLSQQDDVLASPSPSADGLGNFEEFLLKEGRYRVKVVGGREANRYVPPAPLPIFKFQNEKNSNSLSILMDRWRKTKDRCTSLEHGNSFSHHQEVEKVNNKSRGGGEGEKEYLFNPCQKGEGEAFLSEQLLRRAASKKGTTKRGIDVAGGRSSGSRFLRAIVTERRGMGSSALENIDEPPVHVSPIANPKLSEDVDEFVSSIPKRVWPRGGFANKTDGTHELICSWQTEPPIALGSLSSAQAVETYLGSKTSSNLESGTKRSAATAIRNRLIRAFKLVTGSPFERWYDWESKIKDVGGGQQQEGSKKNSPLFQFTATQYVPDDEKDKDAGDAVEEKRDADPTEQTAEANRKKDRLYVLKNACLRPSGRLAGFKPKIMMHDKQSSSYSYQGGNDVQAMVGAANWVEESFFLNWLEDDVEELKEEPTWFIDRPLVLVPMVGEWSAHPGHALQRAGNIAWVADSAFPPPSAGGASSSRGGAVNSKSTESGRDPAGDFARTDVTTAYLHIQTPPGTQHSIGGEEPKCRHQHNNSKDPSGGCQWKDYGFKYYTSLATTTHFMLYSRGDEGYRMFRHHTPAGRAMSESSFDKMVELLDNNPVCFKEIAIWQTCPFELCATPHEGNAWPLWGWRNPKTQKKVAQRFRTCAGVEHLEKRGGGDEEEGSLSSPNKSLPPALTFLYSFRAKNRIRSNMQDTMLLSKLRSFINSLNEDTKWGGRGRKKNRHQLLVSSLEGSPVEFVAVYSKADVLISPYGSGLLYGFVAPNAAVGVELSVLGVAPYAEVGINRFPMTDYGGMYAALGGYHLTAQFPQEGNRFNGKHQIPLSGLEFVLQRVMCLLEQKQHYYSSPSDEINGNITTSVPPSSSSAMNSFDLEIKSIMNDAQLTPGELRKLLTERLAHVMQRAPGAHRLRRTGVLSNANPSAVAEVLIADGNISNHRLGKRGKLKTASIPAQFHHMVHRKDGLALNLRQAKDYVLLRLKDRITWQDPEDYTSGIFRPEAHGYSYNYSGTPRDPRMLSWYRFMARASKDFSGNDPRKYGHGAVGVRLDKNIHWRPEFPSEAICRFDDGTLSTLYEHEIVNDLGTLRRGSQEALTRTGSVAADRRTGFHLRSSILFFLKSAQELEREVSQKGSSSSVAVEEGLQEETYLNSWLQLLHDHSAHSLFVHPIQEDGQGQGGRIKVPDLPSLSQTIFGGLKEPGEQSRPRYLVLVYTQDNNSSAISPSLLARKIQRDVEFFRSHIYAGNRIWIFAKIPNELGDRLGNGLFSDGRPEAVPLPGEDSELPKSQQQNQFLNGGVSFCGPLLTESSPSQEENRTQVVCPAELLQKSDSSGRRSLEAIFLDSSPDALQSRLQVISRALLGQEKPAPLILSEVDGVTQQEVVNKIPVLVFPEGEGARSQTALKFTFLG